MTEPDRIACRDPVMMLDTVRHRTSDRKLRLYACACCRRFLHLMPDKRSREWLELAERYADQQADQQEIQMAWNTSLEVLGDHAGWALLGRGVKAAYGVAQNLPSAAARATRPLQRAAARANEWQAQADLLRDIVSNPFQHVVISSIWLNWNDRTVPKIAQTIYDERAFDHLPILADALEDAGCDNADILAHCRGPGPHVRGCWVVDLLLGKN